MLVTVKDLSYAYSSEDIFTDININIEEKSKIGVVGINGSGKSTILKIIAKELEYSTGNIFYKKNITISYLSQNDDFKEELSVAQIRDNYLQNNNVKEYEINAYLTKLELTDSTKLVKQMSGGERKKLQLALFLSSTSDLLILDEPTNHLDIKVIAFLEKELKRKNSAILMVTHDRYFLERICNNIIEVDNKSVYKYEGNFNYYLEAKAQRIESDLASYRKNKSIYQTELEWMMQGAKARGTKSKKRISEFEVLEEKLATSNDPELELLTNYRRMGRQTIELNKISLEFDNKVIIKDFTYNFNRFERIALLGANGAGKTSFLNLITNEIKANSGEIIIGDTIVISHYKQNFIGNLEQSVKDFLAEEASIFNYGEFVLSPTKLLEKFKFSSNVYYQKLSSLSGGELKRIMLLKALIKNPNVLILDEPTNDLDIEVLAILEQYLESFIGIVIFVSHDRYFIDRVSDNILYLKDGEITKILTPNFDYETLSVREKQVKQVKEKKVSKNDVLKLTYQEKKDLETIDEMISKLENEIADIDEQLALSPSFDIINDLLENRNKLQVTLDQTTERWIYLYSKVEEINNSK